MRANTKGNRIARHTLHDEAAARLLCIRCLERHRKPPWRVCAVCKARERVAVSQFVWRRRKAMAKARAHG